MPFYLNIIKSGTFVNGKLSPALSLQETAARFRWPSGIFKIALPPNDADMEDPAALQAGLMAATGDLALFEVDAVLRWYNHQTPTARY